jgi:hypothetical protein
MHTTRRILLFALALLMLSAAVWAQDAPAVKASLNSGVVYVGDTLIYTIEVVNAEPDEPPTLRGGGDAPFEAEFLREQNRSFSSTVIVNGQVSETSSVSFILYYRVRPLRAGEFEIPSVEIRTDGGVLRTDAVAYRAAEPTAREDLIASLSVSSDSPYVGQPITIELEVLVVPGSGLNNPVFSLPGFSDRFSVEEQSASRGRRSRSAFEFLGAPADAEVDRIERDGKTFDRVRASREVVPTRAGEVELGPGVWISDFTAPRNRRAARVAVPTNTVTMNIRALPEEGRPGNFTGLIGEYSVRALATPTDVRIGDPIRFELTLEGPGNLRDLPAPDLQDFPGFAEGFRLAERDTERRLGDGSVTFRYVLRVITDTVEAIPGVVFNSFDPERGEYALLQTDPIPLEVQRSRVVTAVDGEAFDRPATDAQRVLSAPRTLSANREGAVLLASGRTPLGELVRSPVVLGIAAAPPLGYLALLVAIAYRRRGERGVQPVDAAAAARRAATELRRNPGDDAGSIRAALVLYESLRSATPAGSVTPGEAVERIRREQPDLAAEAGALLEACQAERFGGRAGACDEAHRRRTSELLRAIAKQGVRS